MRRRDFIVRLGTAATWSFAAQAQQPAGKMPRIGFLQNARSELVGAMMQRLTDAGYIEGRNVLFETRIYGGVFNRAVEFANELVALRCDVIFAAAPYAIQASITATSTIPIIATDLESDPVANGWAKSLGRPGGNLTGFFLDLPELGGKQIEYLKEAVPAVSSLAVLWDSTIGKIQFLATELAARAAAVRLVSLPVQRADDLRDAFNRAAREQVQGVVVLSSPLMFGQLSEIAGLALAAHLPTISLFTLFPRSGGFIAYGPNLADMFRRAAAYIDRVLKGANVGDLPIERPSKFEFVINLKTAKALGIEVAPALSARADEVIE